MNEANPVESVTHCGQAIRAYERVIADKITGVVVQHEQHDNGQLAFTHPLHDTLVQVQVEQGSREELPPTVTAAVFVAPWEDEGGGHAGVPTLLRANTRLLGCCVALMPMDSYELAVVLVKRVPVGALPAEQILAAIDDMVWEWASLNADVGLA